MISYRLLDTLRFIPLLYTTRNDRDECDTAGIPLKLS